MLQRAAFPPSFPPVRISASLIRETQIPQGPLLLTHFMPASQSVAIGIFFDVGSRDEDESQAGMAHALEHMLFKGTKKYDVRVLGEMLDMLGGTANAFTARERTCFHMRVLAEDWKRALSILCEMVRSPALPVQEWERERQVIYSEMAMVEDSPEDWVFDRHFAALFPGHPLGRPVLGNREALAAIDVESLSAFLNHHYRPPRMLVALAGGVRHEDAVRYLAGLAWPQARAPRRRGARMGRGAQLLERDDEQAHFCCSFPGINAAAGDRPTAWLANQLLGGCMSSCLFREVREKRGLAYHIGSQLNSLSDIGIWTLSGGAEHARLGECIRVIKEVLAGFTATIDHADLDRAKRQLEIVLRMGMDSCEANMLHLGGRFDESEIRPQSDWVEAVRHVGLAEVRHWVGEHFAAGSLWTVSGTEAALRSLPSLGPEIAA